MDSKNGTGNSSDVQSLFKTVVDGGYCIGCGACASIEGSPIEVKMDQFSKLQACLKEGVDLDYDTTTQISLQKVCPFSDLSDNENVIGQRLYGNASNHNNKLGYYESTFAGYVTDSDFRSNGSSGGMGSWIAVQLFREGLIDGVIHIHSRKPTVDDNRLFHYQLSESIEDIKRASKSRYYPIELSQVMQQVRSYEKKYLIVGVPCFIKAVRLLCQSDDVLKQRIKFCIGLVCGHLKSKAFADMLAWQVGVTGPALKAIDFRWKLEGYGANQYGVAVSTELNGNSEVKVSVPVNQMYGTNWGLGFFKYKACDFCDDVVAETSDVTIGDAWLDRYVKDSQGTNVIIIRNKLIERIIQEAANIGQVHLEAITADEVILSQKSGFEHRREGLQHRLYLTDMKGIWRPIKRVTAKKAKTHKLREKQNLRLALAEESHEAFREAKLSGKFERFIELMDPTVSQYEKLYKKSAWDKFLRSSKRFIKKIFGL